VPRDAREVPAAKTDGHGELLATRTPERDDRLAAALLALGVDPIVVVALVHRARLRANAASVERVEERGDEVGFLPPRRPSRVADIESRPLRIGILADDIDRALESLTARERKVIELRCGFKGERTWTCEEIGRYYGFSAIKVQHIENNALDTLKLWSSSKEHLKS
jgi:DNA-directed RNA polymerase specialized sigma subunit